MNEELSAVSIKMKFYIRVPSKPYSKVWCIERKAEGTPNNSSCNSERVDPILIA